MYIDYIAIQTHTNGEHEKQLYAFKLAFNACQMSLVTRKTQATLIIITTSS